MKRLLICTIARDVKPHLDTWWRQVRGLAHLIRHEWQVCLSVYENDSVDGTADWVQTWLDADERGIEIVIATETLGTQRYPSVWNVDRLHNLAAARNRCLELAEARWKLATFDKVAYIEPDVTYDPMWCRELVLARHPAAAGIEPDVYSGWSLRSEANPKESVYLYDTCATRARPEDTTWQIDEWCGTWRGKSVIPTDLGGPDAMCLHRVWSTFNCLCVYRAKPFAEGLRWDCLNQRLDTGQEHCHRTQIVRNQVQRRSGWLDSDTSVLCEDLRARGYGNVLLNTNCLVRHT